MLFANGVLYRIFSLLLEFGYLGFLILYMHVVYTQHKRCYYKEFIFKIFSWELEFIDFEKEEGDEGVFFSKLNVMHIKYRNF